VTSATSRWTRRHGALLGVAMAAAALLYTGLGRDYLWADEGDTAVLGRSILHFGVPTAWDGVTFTDSDYCTRLTDDFVMVSHPWGQYYAAAASFAVFGDTAFGARFPFALSGLATILLVYAIVMRFSGNRTAALSAALLLTLSTQFLLYARQSRHYALTTALTCLVLLLFGQLRSWRTSALFAVAAILLFHTHPAGAALLAALGLMSIVHRPFVPQRRWFWRIAPVIALFTAPWVLLAGRGYTQNSVPLTALGELWPRLGQYLVECLSVTTLLGSAVLFALRRNQRRARATTTVARSLVLTILVVMACYAIAVALTQSAQDIWVIGLRATPAVLPFVAILTAVALTQFAGDRAAVWIAAVAVLCVTRFGDITPWISWQPPTVVRSPNAFVTFHTPVGWRDRFVHTDTTAFLSSLVRAEPGTVAGIVQTLEARARPGDILITNYEWEPLYFHTNLPQGLKILSAYPIYRPARERGLPEYVFSAEGVRWIVWRRTWGAYRGQACDQLLDALAKAGIPVELVATIPETTWENRENLHFRRFPGGRHLYAWFENVPSTLIYRVDWPSGGR
jgi:4-amino-4-deoxy-L-arabinose transferase-like glycosyltransferase